MTSTRSANAKALPADQPIFNDPRQFPDIYGLTIKGTCMEPLYRDGSLVRISKSEPYAHGDVVTVWFRPELLQPGSPPAFIKRIAMMPPPWVKAFPYRDNPKSDVLALVMLASDEKPDRLLQVRCADVIAIHKVVGPLAPEDSHDASLDGSMKKFTQRRATR